MRYIQIIPVLHLPLASKVGGQDLDSLREPVWTQTRIPSDKHVYVINWYLALSPEIIATYKIIWAGRGGAEEGPAATDIF
jgi:hypothetical protein